MAILSPENSVLALNYEEQLRGIFTREQEGWMDGWTDAENGSLR